VTTPRRTPGTRRPATEPLIPDTQQGEKEIPDTREPDDLPFPDDRRPSGRPEYVIVVDQLRGWQSGQPPSLAELLETGRTRDPEPDLEAEP
jgi:hypothetical protein